MLPAKKIKFAILLIAMVSLAIVAIVRFNDRQIPRPPLPVPNGYDAILRAGAIRSGTGELPDKPTQAELSAFVATNAEAFKLVRMGLQQECRVPFGNFTNHLNELGSIKSLAVGLRSEGQLAELEGRTNDAAQIYLEAIHLGHEACRGGPLIDNLVGIACEAIGTGSLERIAGSLDAATSRSALREMTELENRRENWGEIWKNEQAWMRAEYGPMPMGKLWEIIKARSIDWQKPMRLRSRAKVDRIQLQTRQLMLDLAARAFTLEQGKAPADAAALVPSYLPETLRDPFTGTNLTRWRDGGAK